MMTWMWPEDARRWRFGFAPIGRPGAVILGAVAMGLVAHFRDIDAWVPILDSANLAFHEAGHVVFAIFGDFMHWIGGTLGQLVFPIVGMVSGWIKRATVTFLMCAMWFVENLFNIARYMADARKQELPLAGGGEHDWFHMFAKWGVLKSDVAIAKGVRAVGFAILIGLAFWVIHELFLDKKAADALGDSDAPPNTGYP